MGVYRFARQKQNGDGVTAEEDGDAQAADWRCLTEEEDGVALRKKTASHLLRFRERERVAYVGA